MLGRVTAGSKVKTRFHLSGAPLLASVPAAAVQPALNKVVPAWYVTLWQSPLIGAVNIVKLCLYITMLQADVLSVPSPSVNYCHNKTQDNTKHQSRSRLRPTSRRSAMSYVWRKTWPGPQGGNAIASVRLSVCFHFIFGADRPLTWSFCI